MQSQAEPRAPPPPASSIPPGNEVAENFLLTRNALCPEKFLSERMAQRLARRLRRSAHFAAPLVLRNLLTEEEIKRIFEYVEELGVCMESATRGRDAQGDDAGHYDEDSESQGMDEAPAPEPGSAEWLAEQVRLSALMNPVNYETVADEHPAAWVRCSSNHEKLFLHHGGPMADGTWRTFAQALRETHEKLVGVMKGATNLRDSMWRAPDSGFSERPALNVRCVEFHRYATGGELIDPGHIDVGSTLTLSVQLSPLEQQQGGRFTTTDPSGRLIEYDLQRGDAILFCSETVHNVQAITGGSRNSLVVELWTDPPNKLNRHS